MDTKELRKDFPILSRKINGRKLVYLDNAATSQKPKQVINAITAYYEKHNSNVHRGLHTLSEEATDMYEEARRKVAKFIRAAYPEEIIFTRNTTEALNRVNSSWAINNLKKGDVILTTNSEHHSNLIPWQILAKYTEATLEFIEVNENGKIPLAKFEKVITDKVKLIAISHASNTLGTIFPVKRICKLAKEVGARVVVDGAQALPHMEVNVQSLGCDFYAFSGHKMLGPTGIGVLWAKKELLEKMEPYEYGGGMIRNVTTQDATWADIPDKFEAGTPNIAGAVGLGAAIDYLSDIGMENIREHEVKLNKYALEKLSMVGGISIFGPKDPQKRTGLIAFTIDGIHAHDIASVLSSEGVAVRSGHHCTMPLHKSLEIPASVRASYYLYNTSEEIDVLVKGIEKAKKILGGVGSDPIRYV
jgi:cysteine desulfurase / selenocysteine lyase